MHTGTFEACWRGCGTIAAGAIRAIATGCTGIGADIVGTTGAIFRAPAACITCRRTGFRAVRKGVTHRASIYGAFVIEIASPTGWDRGCALPVGEIAGFARSTSVYDAPFTFVGEGDTLFAFVGDCIAGISHWAVRIGYTGLCAVRATGKRAAKIACLTTFA